MQKPENEPSQPPPKQRVPAAFTELCEVASIGSNGRILFATDDWFAPADWMLRDTEPVFKPDEYTPFGKLMDGWETRRKRIPGHDWCLLELGAPTQVVGFAIDTAFFTGNYAPRVSIQGGTLDPTTKRMLQTSIKRLAVDERCPEGMIGQGCTQEQLGMVNLIGTDRWDELLPRVELAPGYEHTRRQYFIVPGRSLVVRHLRVNMFPDGGIARLRVYGTVKLDPPALLAANKQQTFDLIAMLNGGRCIGYSNAHYGHPSNLIKPTEGRNMGDGWETARRLDRPPVLEVDARGILTVPGFEWASFQLGGPLDHRGCWIERLCIDTKHFRGNYPDSVRLEYGAVADADGANESHWIPLMESHKLGPDRMHEFLRKNLLPQSKPATRVRIIIAPDGGISRFRLFGMLA